MMLLGVHSVSALSGCEYRLINSRCDVRAQVRPSPLARPRSREPSRPRAEPERPARARSALRRRRIRDPWGFRRGLALFAQLFVAFRSHDRPRRLCRRHASPPAISTRSHLTTSQRRGGPNTFCKTAAIPLSKRKAERHGHPVGARASRVAAKVGICAGDSAMPARSTSRPRRPLRNRDRSRHN
jgi:hypothetical protein